MRTILVLLVLISVGCSDKSGAADAGPPCSPRTASDGGVFYDCLGGTWRLCPADAVPYEPCNPSEGSCMGCSDGVGFTCGCTDASSPEPDDGGKAKGPTWLCAGTEYTCQ